MRIAQGQQEGGIEIGNHYDKYGSRNPLVRHLMRGFEQALQSLIQKTGARKIHEVGCGEGYWTLKWSEQGYECLGTDFSPSVIQLAQLNAADRNSSARFEARNLYELNPEHDHSPLVVCCEVLEHVEAPERAVEQLSRLAKPYLVASVPNEPLWSLMNMARGKYLSRWGNTPGHLSQWSSKGFLKLLSPHFEIIEVRNPPPWTLVLAKSRHA